MGLEVDAIFSLLKDGRWHSLEELKQKSQIHFFKIEILFEFLSDCSFLAFDRDQMKAKLSKAFLSFLKRT